MTNENKRPNGNLDGELKSDAKTESPPESKAPPWEADLDVYPLRSPSEDPRWATRTVGCWVVFAIASLILIVVLLVLGAIYD